MTTYIKHKTLWIIQWKQQQQARCKVIAKKHSLNCAISYLPGLHLSIHICSTPCSDKVYTEIRSATNTRSLSPSRSFFAPALPLSFSLFLSLTQPASRAAASVKCQHNKQQQLVRCNNNNNMKSKPVDKVNVQWNDTYHGEVHCMLLLLLSLSLINDSARTQRIEMREGRLGQRESIPISIPISISILFQVQYY